MLYVKKNHGSFVFLIEFVKEAIAINISTQPYFPHNLILVSKFIWGKEYVYKANIVIGWKMVYPKKKKKKKGMKKGSSNYYSNCVLTIVSMKKICEFSKNII